MESTQSSQVTIQSRILSSLRLTRVPVRTQKRIKLYGDLSGESRLRQKFKPSCGDVWRASSFSYPPKLEGFSGFSKWWMEAEQGAVEFLSATSLINEQIPADDSIQMTWNPPNSGTIKINCDASFCSKTKEACVAAVFRDCNGILLGGASKMISTNFVPVAEAMACRLGVNVAIREGWTNVIIESDNSGVISRLSNLSFSNWESAAVESDIISLSNDFNSISFSSVKRCCNKAVDWLVKKFRHFYQLGFSFDSVLDMLNALL
ncbi:hypothetical protein GQ457_17G009380 [Hibiscus cannabinus]